MTLSAYNHRLTLAKYKASAIMMLINSLIAQSVERRTVNPQVPGSSPGRGAKFNL